MMFRQILVVLTLMIMSSSSESTSVRFCCENCTNFDIQDLPGAEKVQSKMNVVKGRPCDFMFMLDPKENLEDVWSFNNVS